MDNVSVVSPTWLCNKLSISRSLSLSVPEGRLSIFIIESLIRSQVTIDRST